MITVGDLGRFIFCERLYFLKTEMGLEPGEDEKMTHGRLRNLLSRHLSMRQHIILAGVSAKDEFARSMASEASVFFDGLTCALSAPVSKDELAGVIVDEMAENIWLIVDELGFEDCLDYLTPQKVEYRMTSKSLGIIGVVDKVYGCRRFSPADILSSAANPCFEPSAAMKLCFYGMLLQEGVGYALTHGFLESASTAERRPIMFTQELKSKALGVLDCAKHAAEDGIPPVCPHGDPRKCMVCEFQNECYLI